ncbi:MAG: acyltransferase family protein [Duganella sp.]
MPSSKLAFIQEVILNTASTAPAAHALPYRPDIDGLRAVAVIAVVLYHCWPLWFVGGFIGVDIFFVISGYLISTILLKQLEAGRFSLLDFYSRRVRRIFPALLVVLAATLLFAWYILLHGEFQQVGKHILAGGGFVSNLVLWFESGYFDNAAHTKPLLHLWSLGVEEQFYIAWPLILWLVFTRRLPFLLVTGVIFCISMTINLITVDSNPTAAFYSPLSRFWELMSGGVAAYLTLHKPAWTASQQRLAAIAGVVLMVAGFALIKPQAQFPGWWALLPVSATFLLIMAGPATAINRHLLGNTLATRIGLISYPLYLWHWPLLAFTFVIYGEKPSYQVKVALMAAAVALAYLTYRYIETPVRLAKDRRRLVGGLTAGMAVMAVLGLGINQGMLRERIDVHGSDVYLTALNDFDFPGTEFKPLRHNNIVFQQLAGKQSGMTVFIGDSLIQHYGPRLEKVMESQQQLASTAVFATGGGCPPIIHTVRLPLIRFPLCPKTMEAAYDLASQPQVHTVVIGAAWNVHFADWNNEILYDTGKERLPFPSHAAHELAYASFADTVANLRKLGKRVYIVLQPPSGHVYDPRNMYEGSRFDSIHPLASIPPLSLEKFRSESAGPRTRLQMIADTTGARLIDPSLSLCDGATCPVLDSAGTPLYTDPLHMRPAYVRRAVTYLDATVQPPAIVSAQAQPDR